MKRTALRRVRKTFEPRCAPSEKVLDDLMRRVVFARDGYACVMCGKPCPYTEEKPDGTLRFAGIQLCHVRTRRYKSVRWDPDNAFTGCGGCHQFKWHTPPAGFDPLAWFRERFPGRLERIDMRLQQNARARRPLDRGLIKVALEQALRRVTPADLW